MSKFANVQGIVLQGKPWRVAQHVLVSFQRGNPLHLLHHLLAEVGGAGSGRGSYQCSLGFTRRGLQAAKVPDHVMSLLALKAPAFWQGAGLRATKLLGLTGGSAPAHWQRGFEHDWLDMVLSVHAESETALRALMDGKLLGSDRWRGMERELTPMALALPAPVKTSDAADAREQWVHFGYRDGLSRIGIEGWTPPAVMASLRQGSRHQPGEFLLGHVADCGADRWVAGPGLRVWSQAARDFFRDASFGVLQQIEQDVRGFEDYVEAAASRLKGSALDAPGKDLQREVKGLLCGRYPEGQPLAQPASRDVREDFDYASDPEGQRCPFSSHVRRMNLRLPRSGEGESPPSGAAAHFSRARALLRRGLPYGPALWAPASTAVTEVSDEVPERGLMAQFFCASIEDQYEHLLGEWADRMPLGSPGAVGVRDPLIGLHAPGDDALEVGVSPGAGTMRLPDLRPFVRTKGLGYFFYPGLSTLRRVANSDLWRDPEDPE